jgi:hypothetical protein
MITGVDSAVLLPKCDGDVCFDEQERAKDGWWSGVVAAPIKLERYPYLIAVFSFAAYLRYLTSSQGKTLL